jgi:hypothetical protein
VGGVRRIVLLGVTLSLSALSSSADAQTHRESNRHVAVVEDLVELLQS